MKRIGMETGMLFRYILMALLLGVCLGSHGLASPIVFQFDEKGHVSLTDNAVVVTGVTQTTGGFDSLGGGTVAYNLPSNYTFALAANINQFGVLVTDNSNAVSDLLIFQNSGGKGQVLVYDAPGAFASESGNGDLAKAYLIPQQGGQAYGDPTFPDANYPNPKSHPEYLNSPAYMQLSLTHLFGNFAESTVTETFVNGGSLSGLGVELIGGDSTIKIGTTGNTTFDFFVSSPVPEPSTLLLLGIGLAGFGFAARRRKK